jgi:3-hydroxybutyryl-CoA dehydrogenase
MKQGRSIRNVAVIGAGLMGHGIAQVFAQGGFHVSLFDSEEKVLVSVIPRVRNSLDTLASNGVIRKKDVKPILSRITLVRSLDEAVTNADYVTEAIIEDLGKKQDLFEILDSLCPPTTILASNTSAIMIRDLSAKAVHKERIIGTHFWNPPQLVPLVEVIRGDPTLPEVMETTVRLMKRIGKEPARVNQDVPGFVGNRLQHALWREAISIVEQGIAAPEDVDRVIKMGFGLRLPTVGPLETADLAGLDLVLSIHDYLFPFLDASKKASSLLRSRVQERKLGPKTGEGFYRWSKPYLKKVIQQRDEFLLYWLRQRKGSRKTRSSDPR